MTIPCIDPRYLAVLEMKKKFFTSFRWAEKQVDKETRKREIKKAAKEAHMKPLPDKTPEEIALHAAAANAISARIAARKARKANTLPGSKDIRRMRWAEIKSLKTIVWK